MVVLVVALVALQHPTRSGTSGGDRTVTETPSVTSSPRTPSSSPRSSTSSRASSTSSSTSSSPAGLVGALPLVVLNNSSRANLASDVGQEFKVGGWAVTSVDENYSNNITSSAAYYDPSVANAKSVAEALQRQFPAVQRVVAKFSPLPDGPIVVILDDDWPTS